MQLRADAQDVTLPAEVGEALSDFCDAFVHPADGDARNAWLRPVRRLTRVAAAANGRAAATDAETLILCHVAPMDPIRRAEAR